MGRFSSIDYLASFLSGDVVRVNRDYEKGVAYVEDVRYDVVCCAMQWCVVAVAVG